MSPHVAPVNPNHWPRLSAKQLSVVGDRKLKSGIGQCHERVERTKWLRAAKHHSVTYGSKFSAFCLGRHTAYQPLDQSRLCRAEIHGFDRSDCPGPTDLADWLYFACDRFARMADAAAMDAGVARAITRLHFSRSDTCRPLVVRCLRRLCIRRCAWRRRLVSDN